MNIVVKVAFNNEYLTCYHCCYYYYYYYYYYYLYAGYLQFYT